ncbi:MAG: MarR family winged helix-turn-helix transcriptional regulator [Promethearchaeota archaeon]
MSKLNNNELIQNNCYRLFRIVKKLSRQFDTIQRHILKEENITPPQFLILRELWKKDGLQSKQLSKITGTSRSTITGVVDTLEKNGFIHRELNPDDRRSWLVKLTKKGREFQFYNPKMDVVAYCPDVEDEEIKEVNEFLEKFSKNMNIPENN